MLGIITLSSELESLNKIKVWKKRFLENNIAFGIDFGYPEEITDLKEKLLNSSITGLILLIATGGTENLASHIIQFMNKPILLWAHPHKNSLAATLEIFAIYRQTHQLKMAYGLSSDPDLKENIADFQKVCDLMDTLKNSRLGIIGEPSDWLLVSRQVTQAPFGSTFVKLNTGLIDDYLEKLDHANLMHPLYEKWLSCNSQNLPIEDIQNSFKLWLALKMLVKENKLDGFTIRCFDLLNNKHTACMALSSLNDEGITAGCESDLHALMGLYIIQKITGHTAWMANPSSVDLVKQTITFAHCTIPSSMLINSEKPVLKTHMESGLSVALEGSLHKEEVTIFRFGNDFNTMLIAQGRIEETNLKNPLLCRTQAVIRIDGKVQEWLDNSLGNHQIIAYGNLLPQLKLFCELNKIVLKIVVNC